MNYYEILEVSPNASSEVIKAAYKSLMQRYHPDRNPGDAGAAERAVLVAQAYEALSDAGKRAVYDIELKSQLNDLHNIQDRARNVLVSASSDVGEGERHWGAWLLIALIIFLLWFFISHFGKKQSSGIESGEVILLSGNSQSEFLQNKAIHPPVAVDERTIPIYLKDLNITLTASAVSADATSNGEEYVLSIQTLGLVVGTFDPDKSIPFLENNREFIGRKLAEKLARAQYGMLIKHNGESYLKKIILDSIKEITGGDRLEESSSTGARATAHYGVEEVLLPDSFTVKPNQTSQAAVP